MKTKIQINNVSKLKTGKNLQVIFDIKLLEGAILIGNVFTDIQNSISFKVKGVGLENKKFDKKSITILVDIINPNEIENLSDQIFISE